MRVYMVLLNREYLWLIWGGVSWHAPARCDGSQLQVKSRLSQGRVVSLGTRRRDCPMPIRGHVSCGILDLRQTSDPN